jgi:ATP-dependent RNA circularization protein (DNA/RNA ligase family)
MEQKKYLDIERVKLEYSNAFELGEDIVVEEKLDGSNVSIVYDIKNDKVECFSRR